MSDETSQRAVDVADLITNFPEPSPESSEIAPEKKRCQSLFLFFSFDLVGSTEFKANGNEWVGIAKWFFTTARQDGTRELSATVWKYAGDEVLFYLEVFSPDGILEAVERAHKVLSSLIHQLHTRFKDTKGKLSIKGMVWMSPIWVEAVVNPNCEANHVAGQPSPCTATDEMFQISDDPEGLDTGSVIDFLGPNIDIGFRLSRFARQHQIVVSANLAYFILKRSEARAKAESREGTEPNAHDGRRFLLVEFQPLKGVLGGDHYPCIWFRAPGTSPLETDFFYDDPFKDSLVKKAIDADRSTKDDLISVLDGMHFKRQHSTHSHLLPFDVIEKVMERAIPLRPKLKDQNLATDSQV